MHNNTWEGGEKTQKSYLNESGICAWYQRFMSNSPKYTEGFPCPYIFTCQVKTETLVSGERAANKQANKKKPTIFQKQDKESKSTPRQKKSL